MQGLTQRGRCAVQRHTGLSGIILLVGSSLLCAQQPPAAAPQTPVQLADATPKGQLKNPYADGDAASVAAGERLYMSYGCNGCHGGTGGGGICPPLTNDVWVYGGDDDTLFRLVAYGSQALQDKGYSRVGQEEVVAPMPPMGTVVKTADELWHILTWVRSNYHGAAECKFGCKN
ncbi:MAG: c-type cytochrome [Proteobacteria bacterium]|nr:c-type cytochrome [Pseudomonadota bacterium]